MKAILGQKKVGQAVCVLELETHKVVHNLPPIN